MTKPCASMDYCRLLLAATEIVLSSNQRSNDSLLLDSAELGVSGVLKPHQVEGVSWLIRRYEIGVNVLLGDEMGLGKTVQAIAFMSYLKKHKLSSGPFLVLCPLSITDGWLSEFNKFCQNLKVIQYVGDREHRRALRRMMYEHLQKQSALCKEPVLSHFDVLLTTYEVALMDREFLSQIPWHYAVIDEAQRLKNPSSVLYRALELEYIIPRRLLMTGTPIQNNLSELWSLMHFCMPSVFGTLEQFVSTFKDAEDPFTGQNSARSKEQLRLLKHVLKAFMLRRTKAKLIERGTLALPPLTEITVLVPLVALQRKVYMSILRRELPALLSLTSGAYSHQSLQNTVMQLRKVCSHPYLFNGIEPEPYVEGEHLVQAAGKLLVLDLLLQKLHADGHRVLIFAQMTRTLDILQDFLELRKYTYERLDGSIRAEERFAAIRKFGLSLARDMEPQVKYDGAFIFMISTRAGGVGLNLVAADTVIFYEQDWNPQVDKQALQRSHRIGQVNHVLSINLVTQNTIEEVIMRRAERKLQLSNYVMAKEVEYNKAAGKDAWIDGKDMRSLILGLQVFDPTDSNVNNFNVENMMELSAMTEKIVQLRNCELSNKGDAIYEINPTDVLNHCDSVRKNVSSFNLDIGLDETSYLSWIEKFKEISPPTQNSVDQIRRKKYSLEERHLKQEADRRKAEEKKLARWEAFGYYSLVVKGLEVIAENDLISDSGSVQFVYGDCTKPNRICPSESAIIFSCVDNSGNWGHGGMFTALTNLSTSIPDAFHRAFEFDDLHMGDLHLVKLKEPDGDSGAFLWVALAVVQSYNSRRKVPRSGISIEDLETCLSKASISASQNSASIHMPRIGYQDGSQRSEWYTIERLLHKYASLHGISIFVYYYRRTERREAEETAVFRAH